MHTECIIHLDDYIYKSNTDLFNLLFNYKWFPHDEISQWTYKHTVKIDHSYTTRLSSDGLLELTTNKNYPLDLL